VPASRASCSPPCVSFRRRSLLARWRRRRIGTPSLGAKLAGYGTGARVTGPPKVPSMREASGSLLVRGVCGPVPSGCYVGIRTPTLRLYPCKSGLLSTGGCVADIGDAFMAGDAA
jgi:hypothetical protein